MNEPPAKRSAIWARLEGLEHILPYGGALMGGIIGWMIGRHFVDTNDWDFSYFNQVLGGAFLGLVFGILVMPFVGRFFTPDN